ncbi:hypothetical protein P879_00981 [Paragonimus westermani]|uniref:Otopetrin n=1 Tax=Paragonimus westermani TaxID=34504 RepID=A0A8T0DPS7_9TREM|nr:hypothetical protein P879_00981 [Paragonimus westermani]
MKGGMKSDDFRMKHQQGSSKENGLRMSANAARKAKVHGQRVIAMLYCIVILAIGLSITLFCTGQPVPENEPSFMGFFISMYLTSVAGMLYILGYIFQNRHASIEAIQKGNLSAPRILFSMRGEAVSLYLRIGVCIFAIMAIVFAACRAHELLLANGQLEYIIPYTVSRILFFIVQTVFLLLLHRLVMLAKVRLFSFIMLHLLTVNLCIWVEAAIEKVSHTIKGKHKIENYTMNTEHQKTSITGYFLPAVSEYCAIAVAVIYEMSQRIGQLKQIVAHHEYRGRKANVPIRIYGQHDVVLDSTEKVDYTEIQVQKILDFDESESVNATERLHATDDLSA